MKYVFCSLWSSILRDRFRGVDPKAEEHWAVRGVCSEAIEQLAWSELTDWVGQESRRTALLALSELLEADLPLSPTTEQLLEVRRDLAQLEADALSDRASVGSGRFHWESACAQSLAKNSNLGPPCQRSFSASCRSPRE
jgi:hypothetical protein